MRSDPRPQFGSNRQSYATPRWLYDRLHREFGFTLDPCPLDESAIAGAPLFGRDGLARSWVGERVYCNPPYDNIGPWLAKAWQADLAVYLVPARTSSAWWHDFALGCHEIRFVRKRLTFEGASNTAPFPSVVLVYNPAADKNQWCECPRLSTLIAEGNGE